MERLNPLHFEHFNGFTAHVAHIYCQQAPVVMDILLMTPVCPGSPLCLDPAGESLTLFSQILFEKQCSHSKNVAFSK